MTVCVIIPALRPLGTLAVLEQVAGQCTTAIVVDNAAGAVGDLVRQNAPWAKVLTPTHNLGFGAAIDLAVRECEEEYVVVLNDDVVPRTGFLANLLAPFADPGCHQVAGCLFVMGSTRVDSVGLAFDRSLRAENVHRVQSGVPSPPIIGPSGAAAAYRRSTYLEVGGFAPELFAYWEDADLALRFWAAGYGCHLVLDAVADHRRGTSLQGRSPRQRELDAFGRGFVLGRYRAWMSPIDRLLVPLVDWPSIFRGCLTTRGVMPVRARRKGYKTGAKAPIPMPARSGSAATRSTRATLRGQLTQFMEGPREAVPDPEVLSSWVRTGG
jgi:GT2 family glycosyltransferase